MGATATTLKKQKFLEHFAKTGNASKTCREINISRNSVKFWLRKDRTFQAGSDDAQVVAIECMEEEAHRRGVEGTLEPVYFAGKAVGAIRKYSDTMLIFLLKAAKPEKYRDFYYDQGGHAPHATREELLSSIHGKLARLAQRNGAPAVLQEPERGGTRGDGT
jgi:hypothetical protein